MFSNKKTNFGVDKMANRTGYMAETFNIERTPEPRPRDVENAQAISLWVGRTVCQAADIDFLAWKKYQWQLAQENEATYEDEDGRFVLRETRLPLDDESAVIMPAEKLHITHIEAGFVRHILSRNFAREDGRFIKPNEVKRKIFKTTKYYRQDAQVQGEKRQDALLYELRRGPERRGVPDFEADADDPIAMNSGQFATIARLGSFGIGNKFGVRFTDEANRFLTAERDRALDIVTGSLGVTVDRDLLEQFSNREPHATLIELGEKSETAPQWRVRYPDHSSVLPDRLVTDLDPKASVIIRHE